MLIFFNFEGGDTFVPDWRVAGTGGAVSARRPCLSPRPFVSGQGPPGKKRAETELEVTSRVPSSLSQIFIRVS